MAVLDRHRDEEQEELDFSDDCELEMLALGLNKFTDPSNLVDAVVDRRNNPIKA